MYENPNGESNPRHTYEIEEKHTYGTDILRPLDSGDDGDDGEGNDGENGDGENSDDGDKNRDENKINNGIQIDHVGLGNSDDPSTHNPHANRIYPESGTLTSTHQDNLEMPNSNPVQKIGHVGLGNSGNTCYLNSTLQSLLHTNILMKYFLDNKNLDKIGGGGIVEAFGNLAKEMSEANENPIEPNEFFEYLKNNWTEIKTGDKNIQQDAEQVLTFILNELSEGLSKGLSKGLSEGLDSVEKQENIIKSLFDGKEQSLIKCKELALEQDPSITDFKILSLPLNNMNSSTITIMDCLNEYTKDEPFSFDWIECPGEKTKKLSILKPPPILIIQLKRFNIVNNISIKINKSVDIPLDLDISNYITNKDENINTKYKLYSVIQHHSDELQSGHYTATIRDIDTDNVNWYKYNDSTVTVTEVEDAENLFKNDTEAYILFYAREDIKNANIDNGNLVFKTTP